VTHARAVAKSAVPMIAAMALTACSTTVPVQQPYKAIPNTPDGWVYRGGGYYAPPPVAYPRPAPSLPPPVSRPSPPVSPIQRTTVALDPPAANRS
jgi:hypothetical protein